MPRFDVDGFLAAVERRDVDKLMGYFADDVTFHVEDYPKPIRGKDTIRRFVDVALPAVESIHLHPELILQQEGEVALLLHASASYSKDVKMGSVELPLAGKTVETNAAVFMRINEEGKIGRYHRVRDNHSVMQQLGISEEDYERIAREMLVERGA